MRKRFAALLLVTQIIVLAAPAFADRITLKNGDRITGTIVKKDGEKITIQTESAGTIEIKWDAVSTIEAENVLYVELKDGSKVAGKVETTDEGFRVTNDDDSELPVSLEQIKAIRNEEQEAVYQAQILEKADGSFFNRWSGSADVGFSLTTGNAKTRSLTFAARGERVSEKDKISVYAKGIQASNSTSGTSVTTAQAFWFGGRYDRNLSEKTFVFGKADFEYDRPQELNLRAVAGGGFGYRWIRSDRTKLDIFGGATFNREYYGGADNRSSAEALIGEEFEFKLTDISVFEQRLEVFPNISRPGTVRARFDASFVTSLNGWLGWHVSVGDRFNSEPLPGKVQNDLLFSTGLRATFGKED
ncbi:MAG: DUF481 domain-containing protein [Acidobacteriota bacterium]|nr:MAG: DUF481 domain-containing protein [Acidobacteriota bacterium]